MKASPNPDSVSVVYVVGSGRSGTTLVDTILGNHPRFYGAGELGMLSVDDLFHHIYCPCKRRIDECDFWQAVIKNWFERTGLTKLEEHCKIRRPFEGPRLRGLTRLIREKYFHSRLFEEYAHQTTELYRAIRQISGRETIVDSSAIPMRALSLSMMPRIDLRVIHIVRDARGVAWSLKKDLREDPKSGIGRSQLPRPVWRSALTWMGYNMLSNWICRSMPSDRVHFCRYEDIASDSETTLRQLGEFLQCDFEEIIHRINSGGALKVGCTFAGNRMRMQGEIRLRLDTDWVSMLTPTEKRTLTVMCGRMMRKYAYQPSSEQESGTPS